MRVGISRPKSFDCAGGTEDDEVEAQRAQKEQQLEEGLNSLPAQLEMQTLRLQADVSNNETIPPPLSAAQRPPQTAQQ